MAERFAGIGRNGDGAAAVRNEPAACVSEQLRQMRGQVDPTESQQNTQRRWLPVLVPILAVYLLLAFYRLEYQSLWLDEVISVLTVDSTQPILSWERWFGGRGPLYRIVLQLWPKWGTAEFAFRSFSVLLGAIVVCLAYALGRILFNDRVAWISASLFATSPFLIWYSQEARYINLGIATAMLAMYSFVLALTSKRPVWWLLYVCSAVLAIAAFVVNLLLPLANALWSLRTVSGSSRRSSLACHLVIFALFAWWANDGSVRQVDGYWVRLIRTIQPSTVEAVSSYSTEEIRPLRTGGGRESHVLELPYTLFAFSAGFSLGPSLRDLHVSRSLAALKPHSVTLLVLLVLFGALFVAGLMALLCHSDRKIILLWFALPLVGAVGVAAVIPGLAYNVRYATMAFPPYVLILSLGLAGLRPVFSATCLSAVLLVNGVSLANYYYHPRYAREDVREAAGYLEAAEKLRDVIIVVGSPLPIRYYYKGNLPITVFDGRRGINTTDYLRELRKSYDRVWLVEIRPWSTDPKGFLKTALDRVLQPEHREFPGVNVYRYDLTRIVDPVGQVGKLAQNPLGPPDEVRVSSFASSRLARDSQTAATGVASTRW